jgi:hypothetical protein
MFPFRELAFGACFLLLLGLILGNPLPVVGDPLPEPVKVVELEATPEEVEALPEVVGESETTPFDIFRDIGKIINDWRKIGWIAGLIALINLLINLLRFKPINEFLEEKDLKWLKPLAACVLGGALGGLTTYQTGVPWLNSVAAGVLTALGSVGFHELISTLLARTTQKYKGPQPV